MPRRQEDASASEEFEPTDLSVQAARLLVDEIGLDARAETTEHFKLIVSELASNVVRHAHTPYKVSVWRAGDVVGVEVTDRGCGLPVMRDPATAEVSGRGLWIVDSLSAAWGVVRDDVGKTVWAVLDVDGD